MPSPGTFLEPSATLPEICPPELLWDSKNSVAFRSPAKGLTFCGLMETHQ